MTEQTQTREPPGTSIWPQGSSVIELEMPVRWWIDDSSVPRREAARACRQQALLLWPRLDPYRLARTRGDPWRIARLVARRTPRSLDEIVAMLTSSTPACPIVPARSDRAVTFAARTVSHG
jgi:hypothetical protein